MQRPLGRQEGTLHCPVATLACHKCVAKYQPPASAAATAVEEATEDEINHQFSDAEVASVEAGAAKEVKDEITNDD